MIIFYIDLIQWLTEAIKKIIDHHLIDKYCLTILVDVIITH